MLGNPEHVLELLKDVGLVTTHDIEEARNDAANNGGDVVNALIESGRVTRLDVTKAVANSASMEFVERIDTIPGEVLGRLNRSNAKRYHCVPLGTDGDTLRIAIADPYDFDTIDTLGHLLKVPIEPVIAPPEEIAKAIQRYYGADSAGDAIPEQATEASLHLGAEAEADPENAPLIQLCNMLIMEAYRLRGSDIHLEPLERRLRVRYRIDGVMQEMQDQPKRLQASIISRYKLMSGMDIAEKRVPQDGRIQITVPDASGKTKSLDLRVSTVPTNHGESIVMRILDKSSVLLGLPELGFFSDDQAVMERILGLADGIFLVTGPTGSGKTTTLYACLNYLNKSDRKIITVEDPVEYMLKGVNQVQVNAEVNMTFAAALRAMLRQAPNIIMVGEIRDAETANIAVNASLTGHLVFSTLHTNDAPGAITRLVDIGVKPFLVASSLRGIMAQRLIRRLCPKCKRAHTPSDAELSTLGVTPSQITEAQFMEPVGCENCRGTGFRGRLGIFEVFSLTDDIRHMINDKVTSTDVRARARQLGMRTLREDGVRKVLAGITSVAEVISATVGDRA
jgi:general secretion pathway protein E/type IV pilus assembly protein PilB